MATKMAQYWQPFWLWSVHFNGINLHLPLLLGGVTTQDISTIDSFQTGWCHSLSNISTASLMSCTHDFLCTRNWISLIQKRKYMGQKSSYFTASSSFIQLFLVERKNSYANLWRVEFEIPWSNSHSKSIQNCETIHGPPRIRSLCWRIRLLVPRVLHWRNFGPERELEVFSNGHKKKPKKTISWPSDGHKINTSLCFRMCFMLTDVYFFRSVFLDTTPLFLVPFEGTVYLTQGRLATALRMAFGWSHGALCRYGVAWAAVKNRWIPVGLVNTLGGGEFPSLWGF